MKIFKILVWVSLVLIVIVVGGVFAITNLVDPNDYKSKFSEVVKQNTGRDLRMDGDLKFTFFPWLGVETGALSLSNATGFYNTAQAYGETAAGLYSTIGTGNPTLNVATDRLFVLGNGTSPTSTIFALFHGSN